MTEFAPIAEAAVDEARERLVDEILRAKARGCTAVSLLVDAVGDAICAYDEAVERRRQSEEARKLADRWWDIALASQERRGTPYLGRADVNAAVDAAFAHALAVIEALPGMNANEDADWKHIGDIRTALGLKS